jgi:hypothetical protein
VTSQLLLALLSTNSVLVLGMLCPMYYTSNPSMLATSTYSASPMIIQIEGIQLLIPLFSKSNYQVESMQVVINEY